MQQYSTILFLRSVLDAYGVSKIMIQLATELQHKGYRVVFGSDNNYDEFKKMVESRGFRHYTVPLRADRKNLVNFIVSFKTIFQIIQKEKINIIHSHHRWSSFISFFIAKILRIPLVTTYHFPSQGNKITLWGDRIISVSADAKKQLVDYFKVDPERINVIHNGIEIPGVEEIDLSSKKETGVHSKRQPVIASIARLSPEKDHATLLQAFAKVVKIHPDAKLLLVGNGPLENALKTLTGKLNISDKTEFLGEVMDAQSILSACDCVVLSSLKEGLPLAILEAFAHGKPVVATKIADVPAVVTNGENGLLVSPGKPEELASALNFIIANRQQALAMGLKGREIVSKQFSVQIMAEQTEKIYLELLSNCK